MGSPRALVRLVLLAFVLAVLALTTTAQAGTLKRPIDPKEQTGLAFGQRSHWLQPWRAYLDTPPASRLRNAIGINFNVSTDEAPATARLLGRSGFRRARVEIGWDQMDFKDPSRLADPGRIRRYLGALKANGIRPLILLNANHGIPTATRFFEGSLVAAAPRGATRVQLDAATAAAVVPGKTGLNSWNPRRAADVLFTSISPDGWATLSRPLPRNLDAGTQSFATLRFAPFGPPKLANGAPNPAFKDTLGGWLQYAGAVTREAKAILGGENFDVEVWNELTFGSDFLYQKRYYSPDREQGKGDVTKAILNATVGYLRDPRHGVSHIGIGNGFANQRPWDSGATSPRGLTALDKHPYYNMKRFPSDAIFNGVNPLDARSHSDSVRASGGLRDRFIPHYNAFFPEYILSGIQTEHLVRDISPITTDVYRYPHGRATRSTGSRPLQTWITEANLDPTTVGGMSDRDVEHLQAKAALRYYTAYANKGVSAVHLFAAKSRTLGLVEPSFFEAVKRANGGYPGDVGGETPEAVGRLTQTLDGAANLRRTRPLSLLRISDKHNHRQFNGDGTAAHPPLYNRDVLAFFPFQLKRGEYVASVYVMTRDMAKTYSGGSNPARYDLPPERYSLTLGGFGSGRVAASATDPMTGKTVPVKARKLEGGRLRVSMPVTDSPRMLRLTRAH